MEVNEIEDDPRIFKIRKMVRPMRKEYFNETCSVYPINDFQLYEDDEIESNVIEYTINKTGQQDDHLPQPSLQDAYEWEESGCNASKGSELDNQLHHSLPFQVDKTVDNSSLVKIDKWFPIFCNGICRIVWETAGPKKLLIKTFISGAILDFNSTEGVVSTYDTRYKISEKINTDLLNKFATVPESVPLLTVSEKHWIKDIVNMSRNFDFHFKERIPKLGNHKKTVKCILVDGLTAKRPVNIFEKHKKCFVSNDHVSLNRDLEEILETCNAGKNWIEPLNKFLHRCGQSTDVLTWGKNSASILCQKTAPTPYCENNDDIETYEKFKSGRIINSTFDTVECTIVMWAVMKEDNGDTFYISGLVRHESDKLRLINPEKITFVSQNGRSVSTPGFTYNLIGPMYAVAVAACYLGTPNMKFLEAFQYYFSNGIPENWKDIVSIMHIICKCSLLKYNIDSAGNKDYSLTSVYSPSYISDFSIQVRPEAKNSPFKIPAPVINHKHGQVHKKQGFDLQSLRVSKVKENLRDVINSITQTATSDTMTSIYLQPAAVGKRDVMGRQCSVSLQKCTADQIITMTMRASKDHIQSNTGNVQAHNAVSNTDLDHDQIPAPVIDRMHDQVHKKKSYDLQNLRVSKITEKKQDVINPITDTVTNDTMTSTDLQPDTVDVIGRQCSVSVQKCTSDENSMMTMRASKDDIQSNIGNVQARNAGTDSYLGQDQLSIPTSNVSLLSDKQRIPSVTSSVDVPVKIFINLADTDSSDDLTNSPVTPNSQKKKKRRQSKPITYEGILKAKKRKSESSKKNVGTRGIKKSRFPEEFTEKSSGTTSKRLSETERSLEQSITTSKNAECLNEVFVGSSSSTANNESVSEESSVTTNEKARIDMIEKDKKTIVKKSKTKKVTRVMSESMDKENEGRVNTSQENFRVNSMIEQEIFSIDTVKSCTSSKTLQIRNILDNSVTIENGTECNMVISGQDVNLLQIPVTRSGRVSLPPRDPINDTEFKKVGNTVVLKRNNKVIVEFVQK